MPASEETAASTVKTAAAEKTKKALWALPGALATIGGIVGLYQFILAPNSSVSVAERTQTELLEMVSSGKMTAKEAQAFAQTLKDLNTAEASEGALPVKAEGTPSDITKTAAELAASDNPKKRMAIVLLADKKTREDGIVMLEGTAKTSDDWLDVAELSWGWDNDRTLKASRRAVTLDPSNYSALSLLASAQIANNEYKDAQKTAMAIMVVAETDAEKITAYSTLSHPQQALGDPEGLKDTAENLKALLASHKEANTFDPRAYDEDTVEDSPSYTQYDGYVHVGNVQLILGDYDAAMEAYNDAKPYISSLIDAIPADEDLGFRLVQIHQAIASAYHRQQNYQASLEEMKSALTIVKDMTERGVARSNEYLPKAYGGVASLETFLENYEGAETAFHKMAELLQSQNGLNPKRPEDWMPYVNARMGEAHALAKLGKRNEGDEIVEAFTKQAETNLKGSPEEHRYYSALSQTSGYAGYYFQELGETDTAAAYATRPAETVKTIDVTDGNRELIESAILGATVNEADIYHRAGQPQKAEKIYLESLKGLQAEIAEKGDEDKPSLRVGVLYQRLSSLELAGAKDYEAKAFDIYTALNSKGELPLEYQDTYMTMLKERDP